MLKDSNIDPPLVKAHETSLFGQDAFPNSPNHATNLGAKSANYNPSNPANSSCNNINLLTSASPSAKTPRSSHKVVTPLRKQSTSFLVASLESLFSDSQGVTDQIAKITAPNTSNSFKSPASNLAASFASLSTNSNFQTAIDSTLADPNLLQSHVQNSFIGLDTYTSTTNLPSMKNSLYSTPIRSKQSKSHDFSELPSQQRLKARRSSILAQDEDLSLLTAVVDGNGIDNAVLLSDLSHFKDNEDVVVDVIHELTSSQMSMSKEDDGEEFNYFDEQECKMEISPMKLATKRSLSSSSSLSRTFTLPSTAEYQDGSKPPFSYASLIAQAIISNPKKRLALSSIYTWIMDTYPFYQIQSCGWQNSIRHNLSLNKCFKKIPRDDDEPGKGCYWTVDLDEMDDFEDGMFKRRRSSSSGSGTNSACNSNNNSTCASVMNSPSSNNAFLNGTGWSPLINHSTPNKAIHITSNNTAALHTPKHVTTNSFVKNSSVPMTPLTMSLGQMNTKTPVKSVEHNAVLTPKLANCTNRSPYTCLAGSVAKTSKENNNNVNSNSDPSNTATFWSYPNLSLSQLGLDSEPPLPELESNTLFHANPSTLPELFQSTMVVDTGSKDQFTTTTTRMSPLSWLLSVSSQDSSLGLFDQSQQLLSEYLSLNM